MTDIKTVILDGSELKVEGLGGQNTAIINKSGSAVYASAYPNIVPDGDNVIEIVAGDHDGLYNTNGTVYLLGTGKVNLRGTDYTTNFSQPSRSADGGGSTGDGVSQEYVDSADALTLRSAKEYTDTAVSADIGALQADITALQTEKADKSSIPESLPANGGNADTVNNHTVKSNVPENAKFTDTTYKVATTAAAGLMSATDKTKLDNALTGIQIGTVSTGAAGSAASVTASTVDNITTLNLSIPKGDTGATGTQGAKGDTGTAAGFGTPTATVDANVGTPSVTVTASGENTAKVFNFAFKNLKGAKGDKGDTGDTGAMGAQGAKGDTGTAAGFGTPTATVDANVGTPSVTVTASGANTAKVFNFAFKNLKGAKGDKGDTGAQGATGATGAKGDTGTAAGFGTPTATVDANVGTPSVTVTASCANTAKVFNFAFKNLKGAKGDKGDTGAQGATGAKGDTGTAAGFGTPTATVDANVGTPSVTVTASGENTAKVFNFAFKNLKGAKDDKGDTGAQGATGAKGDTGTTAGFGTPTATIDANVGTPSVTVTASGVNTAKVFNFAFKNLKGAKGDKGDTGAQGATGAKGDKGDSGVHYGTCSTAAATAAKVVELTGFTLVTGAAVIVAFTVTNTAANPTLNVNGTGAKAIRYKNAAISAAYLAANKSYLFAYDGSYWQLVGDVDTNTTYSNATSSKNGLMSAADKTKLNDIDMSTKMDKSNPTGTGAFSMNRKSDTEIGNYSVAAGYLVTASGAHSHAEGNYTTASNYASHAGGKSNKPMTDGGASDNQIGDVFVIGNGKSNAPSNAFRITYAGDVYGTKAYTSSGADYAEFIKPWFDDNPDGEDRIGYFVTIKDGKLRFAEPNDYIVGITSGNPSVVGNGDEDWLGRWEHDEFNRIIREDVEETEEIVDEETGAITYEPTGRITPKARFKTNPDYDPSQKYVERKDRSEWDYVGMIGVLPLRDDGTCVAGGFAKCGAGGIATAADEYDCRKTFFVIERITDNVISVEMR